MLAAEVTLAAEDLGNRRRSESQLPSHLGLRFALFAQEEPKQLQSRIVVDRIVDAFIFFDHVRQDGEVVRFTLGQIVADCQGVGDLGRAGEVAIGPEGPEREPRDQRRYEAPRLCRVGICGRRRLASKRLQRGLALAMVRLMVVLSRSDW